MDPAPPMMKTEPLIEMATTDVRNAVDRVVITSTSVTRKSATVTTTVNGAEKLGLWGGGIVYQGADDWG